MSRHAVRAPADGQPSILTVRSCRSILQQQYHAQGAGAGIPLIGSDGRLLSPTSVAEMAEANIFSTKQGSATKRPASAMDGETEAQKAAKAGKVRSCS